MATEHSPAPESFVFETASFYSRSGFKNGDILRPAFPNARSAELRDLLVDVLYRHVIPALDQTVQVVQIPSGLNPLRAAYVNGTPVHWSTAASGNGPPLTPSPITVGLDKVIACARKLRIEVPAVA